MFMNERNSIPLVNSSEIEENLRIYRLLRRIRLFEERLVSLFEEGKVYGTAHTCIGQEAVAVGSLFDLETSDFVTGTHRSHGHCIAKGADVGKMMAELLGKADGYCGGKGGSMHIADLDLNMLGCNGLVSAGVPHAAGAVMAAQLRGENRVAVAFHGDGAANQGVLYETLNLAAIWKLPLIVVCENNQYALSTPYSISQAGESVAARAAGFGIPAQVVDGMDVHAVRDATRQAIERARDGGGPEYIQCETYRYVGHSLRNDRPKRTAEEIASWKARDPLDAVSRELHTRYDVSPDLTAAIDAEEAERIEAAVAAAEKAPEPAPETLMLGIYCDDPYEEVPAPRSESDEERSTSYAGALNEALNQAMELDDRVMLFGEDVAEGGGVFGVSAGLKERFGADRVRDTPISEQAITGVGIGLALGDARPIVEIQFMDIMTLAADQLVNQAAKLRYMLGGRPRVPLVVRAPMGAGVKLAAQHSQSLETWFMHIPGLIVVAPSTPYDAKGLLHTAIRNPNPVVFLEHKLLYLLSGPVPEELYTIPFGVAEVKREGSDVTVVATSGMVRKALQAARRLKREGISVEVVDPRTLAPLDIDTIVTSVEKTGRLVVVHEACRFAGFGGEIAAAVTEKAFDALKAPPLRIGAPSTPVPYNAALEQLFIPSEKQIIETVRQVCHG
jgi:2-oxoisovalerate dehydrogenase E1 component